MTAVLGLWSLLFSTSAHAACVHTAYLSEIEDLADKAEQEYPAMDAGSFVEVSGKLLQSVECLEEPMRPETAARVHRIVALRARVAEGNIDAARMAFAASRKLDDRYTFPKDMIGPRDPENIDYTAIPTSMRVTEEVRRPIEGNIRFDGQPGRERPVNWPTIYQRFEAGGSLAESKYLWPGDKLPGYQAVPEGTLDVEEVIFDKVLPAATAGLSAAALGMGIALISTGTWDKNRICLPDEDQCILQAKERLTTGYIIGAAGLGGFALTGVILFLDADRPGLQIHRRF